MKRQDHLRSDDKHLGANTKRSLIVIDQQTISQLGNTPELGANTRWCIIDIQRDPFEQLEEAASSSGPLHSLHLFATIKDGSLRLGRESMRPMDLPAKAPTLGKLGRAISPSGCMFVYSASYEDDEHIKRLFDHLSKLIGVPVYSSMHPFDKNHVAVPPQYTSLAL